MSCLIQQQRKTQKNVAQICKKNMIIFFQFPVGSSQLGSSSSQLLVANVNQIGAIGDTFYPFCSVWLYFIIFVSFYQTQVWSLSFL